jgi:ligand-binding sensor domain-containing protein
VSLALCEDSDGNIWVGTSRGVVVYDYMKDRFVLSADQDGCLIGIVNKSSPNLSVKPRQNCQ